MTWPLTFSLDSGASVEAYRENIEDRGARTCDNLEMGEDLGIYVEAIRLIASARQGWSWLTALESLEAIILNDQVIYR